MIKINANRSSNSFSSHPNRISVHLINLILLKPSRVCADDETESWGLVHHHVISKSFRVVSNSHLPTQVLSVSIPLPLGLPLTMAFCHVPFWKPAVPCLDTKS